VSRCVGEVEVDETWIGGTQAGLRGSRQLKGGKAVLVLVAGEKRGRVTGRARMAVIADFKRVTHLAFLKEMWRWTLLYTPTVLLIQQVVRSPARLPVKENLTSLDRIWFVYFRAKCKTVGCRSG
jgi:hypothetical protein